MRVFLLFTNTEWDEPPRIRHQIARLLSLQGHRVIFFEKPRWIGVDFLRMFRGADREVEERILICKLSFLIHHQLLVCPLLEWINSWFVRFLCRNKLKKLKSEIGDECCWVNFNYFYTWLGSLKPSKDRLMFFVNDDFEKLARSRFVDVSGSLRICTRDSDVVMAVSPYLCERLANTSGKNARLFLPWAPDSYIGPQSGVICSRKVALFYGYINERLDFVAIENALRWFEAQKSRIQLRFVGPLSASVAKRIRRLSMSPNFEYAGVIAFNELDLADCFCALNTYEPSSPGVSACYISNKSFQLLARGLPLVVSALPNFVSDSFVFRYEQSESGLQAAILKCHRYFYEVQPDIERFVNRNQAHQRYKELMSFL